MFADVSGSTRLYELLGDVPAREKIAACLDEVTKIVKKHRGVVIKTIGDEIMCTFKAAEQAAIAACQMSEKLERDFPKPAENEIALSLRIGLHFGQAVLDRGDLFGDAVNIASRVAAMAKGAQILTTKTTVDRMPPRLRAGTRFIDRTPVRGKSEAFDIYEIIWQEDEVTRMSTGVLDQGIEPGKLHLRYHDIEVRISNESPQAVMGRSKTCDMTIDENLVSRQHVKIECRKGKFYIIDQSTNGTYVRSPDKDETFLRREEMQLLGTGEISLGRSFNDEPAEVVHYTLTDS